jgi:hypothetical protein
MSSVSVAYFEHLLTHDLVQLESCTPDPRAGEAGRVRTENVFDVLGSASLYELLFAADESRDPLVVASPFLAFAVAIERAASDLSTMGSVPDWLGRGRWAPVFDVEQLRGFMADRWVRFFLAELLSSFTHVASGSVLVAGRRGLRRQRFSELDPVRLAGLLDVVSEAERPGILRRLGDVALFLTGVFPEHVERRGFGPIEQARLLRSSGRVASSTSDLTSTEPGAVVLLEALGRRWYRAAFEQLVQPVAENVAVLERMPEHFGHARRMLSIIAERHLFGRRERWFGIGAG